MEYRSPLNAGYSLEDSLASMQNTPNSQNWSFDNRNNSSRGRPYRQSFKRQSSEPIPIWQYYHPMMLEDPWKNLYERYKPPPKPTSNESDTSEDKSNTTKQS